MTDEIERQRAELAAERDKAFTAMRVFERYRELEAQVAAAEAERDALRGKLAAAFKDAESAAVDAVNACRGEGESDLRSVRYRVEYAIRALNKGGGDE